MRGRSNYRELPLTSERQLRLLNIREVSKMPERILKLASARRRRLFEIHPLFAAAAGMKPPEIFGDVSDALSQRRRLENLDFTCI